MARGDDDWAVVLVSASWACPGVAVGSCSRAPPVMGEGVIEVVMLPSRAPLMFGGGSIHDGLAEVMPWDVVACSVDVGRLSYP